MQAEQDTGKAYFRDILEAHFFEFFGGVQEEPEEYEGYSHTIPDEDAFACAYEFTEDACEACEQDGDMELGKGEGGF